MNHFHYHFSYEKRREGDRLKCNVCGENFRERHHLTRHMTAHQDRKEDGKVPSLNSLEATNIKQPLLSNPALSLLLPPPKEDKNDS